MEEPKSADASSAESETPADFVETGTAASHTPSEFELESRPSHIVCLGASAGGLEALQTFFSKMRSDTGAAFVVKDSIKILLNRNFLIV